MKFYLSLTDEDGVLLDRFRLEVSAKENPDDGCVFEDSEAIGNRISERDLSERLYRAIRQALRKPEPTPAPASTPTPKPTPAQVRRFSRREAVATALGTDISDINAYQPSRYSGIYTEGTHYYCALKPTDTWTRLAKELGPWTMLCDADYLRGWVVYKADGEGN